MMNTNVTDLQEQLERVCAERDRLREALEPFTHGGWGKDFNKNAPGDTPVIVKALPPEALGRSFHLTKADFDRARDIYREDRFRDGALKLSVRDKELATGRIHKAINYCSASGDFDTEEIEHLQEILRLILEGVPAYYFFGFGNFKGSGK